MEFYTEIRLKGDEYGGNYTNGLTLSGSSTLYKLETDKSDINKTVYKTADGIIVNCYHEKNGNVTVCKSEFINNTDSTLTLELLSSFAVKGIKADKIHRATSFWSAEGKLLTQKLTDLNMECSWAKHGVRIEKFGQIGSMPVRKWFPFLVLEDSVSGEFFGVQLYCASSWQIEVMHKDDDVYIQGGIADRDYGAWSKDVASGDSFVTPKAVCASGKSLEEVCDKLVKAQSLRIAEIDKDMPVVFNEYCTTWGNPTLENISRTAKRLEGSGVRYLVIDSGWYKNADDGDWFSKTGDWIPSSELFPNGIKEVADVIKSHGLVPGLWYEFECLGSDAAGYNMTEHILKRDGYPVTVGGRRFWDMRDKWVQNFLDERVIKLLKDAGFGYLKVDYNENIGAGVDGAESYGEGLRQCVEASRNYFKHITEEMPELVLENCSSGGHRLEPSFMELCSQASFSDAHECNSIPLIAANMHRVIRPEQSQIWAVLRANADLHRIYYLLVASLLGRLCLSGEIFDLTDEKWQAALDGVKFYNNVKHIIKNGFTSVIQTTAEDYSAPCGYQAVLREYKSEALLVVHTFKNGANPPIDDLIDNYKIQKTFGSKLDGDFRAKAFLLKK
ncbi:MAG: alpha-galactosidase [Eubacterium sp.]|nr:alpha-galactosidase [Eubacterium sp.]